MDEATAAAAAPVTVAAVVATAAAAVTAEAVGAVVAIAAQRRQVVVPCACLARSSGLPRRLGILSLLRTVERPASTACIPCGCVQVFLHALYDALVINIVLFVVGSAIFCWWMLVKMEVRVDSLKTSIGELRSELKTSMREQEKRADRRMDELEERADRRMDKLEGKLDQLIMRRSHDDRMSRLEGMLGELLMRMPGEAS